EMARSDFPTYVCCGWPLTRIASGSNSGQICGPAMPAFDKPDGCTVRIGGRGAAVSASLFPCLSVPLWPRQRLSGSRHRAILSTTVGSFRPRSPSCPFDQVVGGLWFRSRVTIGWFREQIINDRVGGTGASRQLPP